MQTCWGLFSRNACDPRYELYTNCLCFVAAFLLLCKANSSYGNSKTLRLHLKVRQPKSFLAICHLFSSIASGVALGMSVLTDFIPLVPSRGWRLLICNEIPRLLLGRLPYYLVQIFINLPDFGGLTAFPLDLLPGWLWILREISPRCIQTRFSS